MNSEDLLIELIEITEKYFVFDIVNNHSENYINYLLNNLLEDSSEEFGLRILKALDFKELKTQNKISEDDFEKLERITKNIRSNFSSNSQIFILLLVCYNKKLEISKTGIELLSIIANKLNITEYSLENLLALKKIDIKRIFSYPMIYVQKNPIDIDLIVNGNIHLEINSENYNLQIIKASKTAFFVVSNLDSIVYINKRRLYEKLIYVLNETDYISFNNEKIDFQKIAKMYQIKEDLPNITLNETESTPFIYFNASSNKFEMIGKSVPIDSIAFFDPLLGWLDRYVNLNPKNAHILFHLDYFSTASSKFILEILRRFETLHNNGTLVQVDWLHAEYDEDLKEAGENFAEIIEVPFNILITNNDN